MWNQCQHQGWYFVPWHRGYVFAFEAIIAKTIKDLGGPADWTLPYWNYLEPVREQFDSLEQFVIQESDLILEAADVDARESRALRPKPVALSQRSDRRGMGACGAADPAS